MNNSFNEFGKQFRALRKQNGFTGAALSRKLGCSQSFVSKIENGLQTAPIRLLDRFAKVLGIDEQTHRHLIAMIVLSGHKNFPVASGEYTARQKALEDLESAATRLHSFQWLLVPGLLQTESYAHSVLRRWARDQQELQSVVRARLERQRRFLGRGLHLVAVISEVALQLSLGKPDVMSGQIEYLISASERQNVQIHILPIESHYQVFPMVGFDVVDNILVHFDTLDGLVTVQGECEIIPYLVAFDNLLKEAVVGNDAKKIFKKYIRRYSRVSRTG